MSPTYYEQIAKLTDYFAIRLPDLPVVKVTQAEYEMGIDALRYAAREVVIGARRMEERYGNATVYINETSDDPDDITVTVRIRRNQNGLRGVK